jgi:uncharacterized protein
VVAQEENVTKYPMDESALLWQITNDTIQDTSYIFGTMHMIEKQYYIFPDTLDSIVCNVDVMIMEIAGTPNPMEMLKYVMLPEGSIWDYFNDAQEDTLLTWIAENAKFPVETAKPTFDKMKPFVLIQLTAMNQFTGETESYEANFTSLAESNNIEMVGLETIAMQMKIFDDLTMEEQAEMVMASIRDEEKSALELKKMQEIYYNQQIDSLYMLVHEEGGTISEKENEFLSNRNKNWIPLIIDQIGTKSAFIAVGAAHLGGPDGVIRLLEQKGFTLTPIRL